MPTLRIGDRDVVWTTTRTARARRIRIRVGPEGVVVTVPQGVPTAAAAAFVAAKADWIARALARAARWDAARRAAEAAMVPSWSAGGVVPLEGGWLAFDLVTSAGRRVTVEPLEPLGPPETAPGAGGDAAQPAPVAAGPLRARLLVGAPGHLRGAAREAAIRAAVVVWLRRRAEARVADAARTFGRRLGRAPAEIRLGDARTRWGSCAANGIVRVSWRLILAPPAALDYVVAHEVAHLAEAHHGPEFWAALARIHPAWAEGKATLRAWERSGRAAAGRAV